MKTIMLSILFLYFLSPINSIAVENSMAISEADGVAQINNPISFGRPFKLGEIDGYPQVVINGSSVTTQANVKNRWPDGSVKYAIVSFLTSFSANESKTVTFQNQAQGNETALSQAEMLSAGYNFDATISANFGGSSANTSGRSMLIANSYSSWTNGVVANTIVLADHSISRLYDFGSDAYKSLRPIIYATFYPGINKVKVRFVVESSSTEALQDQSYAVGLSVGSSPTNSVYTHTTFNHYGGSRWTKEFWIGTAPGNINIDYNLAYLNETGYIYALKDTQISESEVAGLYSQYNSSLHDIYDASLLTKDMRTTGLRPDIGPYPKWSAYWMLTGDYRAKTVALGLTDLAGAWGVHFREGDPTKHLDRGGVTPGIGKIMSISERPSLALVAGYSYTYTDSADRVTVVNTVSSGGWAPDPAHEPELASIAYLLTGDHYYLEEGLFWSSFNAADSNGAAYAYSWGRGPTGAEGGLSDQLRGEAWILSQRATMAAYTPDSWDEKALLETWLDDAIAIEEGWLNITTTQNYGSTLWTWGRNIRGAGAALPPLHQLGPGSAEMSQAEYGINTAIVSKATSLFETYYMIISLGRVKQLGFEKILPTLQYSSKFVTDAYESGYNKYLLGTGRLPTSKTGDIFFQNYAELETGYDCNVATCDGWDNDPGSYWGYPFVARAAFAMVSISELTDSAIPYLDIDADLTAMVPWGVSVNPQWYLVTPGIIGSNILTKTGKHSTGLGKHSTGTMRVVQ